MKNLKIYMAGPGVFNLNAQEVMKKLKADIGVPNLELVFPTDTEIAFKSKEQMSKDIFEANKKLIQECDIVLADLNAFRGKEPDSGTVWEVGYAYGINTPVIGHTMISDWASHIGIDETVQEEEDIIKICEDGYIVEDYDNKLNLMISESISVFNSYRECIDFIRDFRKTFVVEIKSPFDFLR